MRKTKKYLTIIVVVSVLSGAAAGMLSGHYTGGRNMPVILSADIKKITEEKKQEIIRKYRDSEDKEQAGVKLEKEYTEFLNALDKSLDNFMKKNKNVLILRKEAVIDGKYKDITDEIKENAKASQ
ncbi:MAG: TrbI F-type domain-containing protein [Proteobacteria bacterium]|nr:TrbI F-type domain-containing protein [Pseudomonadota bacterium]